MSVCREICSRDKESILPQFKLGLAMQPEKTTAVAESRACLVTQVFGMCVGGAGAASRSPEGAAQPAGRTQKRRARREAALDRLERAGELVEPASRAGRWRMQQREQAALLDRLHTPR